MKPIIRERVRGEHGEEFTIYGEHKILTHLPADYQGTYEVPDWVTIIGLDAIRSCAELTSVIIPKSVTMIRSGNFHFCDKLTSIVVDANNPVFDSRHNCNAIIVSVTNTLVIGCNGTIIPDGIESVEEGAFVGCSALQSLYIPASVRHLGFRFWESCQSLSSIVVDAKNPVYDSREHCNAIIETATETLLCSSQLIERFVILDGIRSIAAYAFQSCRNLKSIRIPESVISMGESAFENCHSLDDELHLSGIKVIEKNVFADCMHLRKVVIGSGVTKICQGAFCACVNLKEIVFSDDVRVIDSWAFGRCDSLERITLPSAIDTIATDAFKDCHRVVQVNIPSGTSEYYANFDALKKFRWRFVECDTNCDIEIL